MNCASRTGFYAPHTLANFQSLPKFYPSPRWRELVARAYHNSLYNQCASHFGKLSEFDKVLSFGASRTGFYRSLILPRWRELVARAYHNSLYNQCAPHFVKLSEFDKVLSFGASCTGFYRSLILRSSFAYPSPRWRELVARAYHYPSLILRHILGCASSPTFLRLSFAQGSLGV